MFPRLREGPRMADGRTVGPSRRFAALAVCMAGLTVAACGSGSSSSSPSTTVGRTSTSTTTPPTGAAAQAVSAYRAMWADMVTASQTSDYKSPLLSEHATGSALSVLVQGLAKNQALGIVTKGKPALHPQVTSLTPATGPTQATITDCFDDTQWLEYNTTGGLADNTPGGHRSTTAILVDTDGAWTVTQLAVQATGTC
jgi:hypothetical protein